LKALSSGVFAAYLVASLGLMTPLAVSAQNAAGSPPGADFGTPPSGEIPILFNDHHVYSRPDRLKQNRVLAALVRNGTILVPLRSMFEQMGATVSYDAGTKTVDVSKAGSDVQVTVGKPLVVINGEQRPLDVPPEIYKGSVVVPVRVISEGMGGYVQWVPDKRLVVVRYVMAPPPTPPPPTPSPPPPPPTAAPPPPTPAPTITPRASKPVYEHFIVGDYMFAPKVYNELSPGNTGTSSYRVAGAIEFPLFNVPWMLAADYRQFNYPHNQGIPTPAIANGPGSPCTIASQPTVEGCVAQIGNAGYVFVPSFQARTSDIDGRFGLKIADPRIYVGVGYMYRYTNYGYPVQHGAGFGAEKLPDLDQPFSVYGSAYYFPSVGANFTDGPANQFQFQYRVLKYAVGGTFNIKRTPVFLDFGFLGERGDNKQNAPSDFSESGPYAGLGIHF